MAGDFGDISPLSDILGFCVTKAWVDFYSKNIPASASMKEYIGGLQMSENIFERAKEEFKKVEAAVVKEAGIVAAEAVKVYEEVKVKVEDFAGEVAEKLEAIAHTEEPAAEPMKVGQMVTPEAVASPVAPVAPEEIASSVAPETVQEVSAPEVVVVDPTPEPVAPAEQPVQTAETPAATN